MLHGRFVSTMNCPLRLNYIFLLLFLSLFCVLFTEGMNEDGSFIGLYGRKGKPQPTNNQAFATLV